MVLIIMDWATIHNLASSSRVTHAQKSVRNVRRVRGGGSAEDNGVMAPVRVRKIATAAQRLLDNLGLRLRPGGAGMAERERQRWLAVTVEGDPAQVNRGGQLPGPLAELDGNIEVEVRPGPGSWGIEISARPAAVSRSAAADRQLRARLRLALRQTKQLLEVGEVLVAEPRPEGRRRATVGGKLVDHAVRTADEKGVL